MEDEYPSKLFQNCSIRGLPITLPFRIQYDVQGKDSEIGTFIILPYQMTVPILVDFTNTNEQAGGNCNIQDSSHDNSRYTEDTDEQSSKLMVKKEPQDSADDFNQSDLNERADIDQSQLFGNQIVNKKRKLMKSTACMRYRKKNGACQNNENNMHNVDQKIIKDKQRKTKEIDPELEEIQKTRLVKLEEHGDDDKTDGSQRKSTRLQHARFRPDYRNIESKIDNVLKYLEGVDAISDVEDEEFQVDSDKMEETPAGAYKNKSSFKIKKVEDPDFDPSELYANIKNESVDVDNELSDIEDNSETDSEDLNQSSKSDEKKPIKNAGGAKKKPNIDKPQIKRIFVKLEEHPDKYKIEALDPLKRKDRGKTELERSVTVYACTLCHQFNSESVEGIEGHLENHLNGELTCTECDYFSTNVAEVLLHKAQMHTKDRSVCPECGVTVGYGRLKIHYGIVHDNPQYACVYCQKNEGVIVKFATCSLLQKHLRASHKEVCLTCKLCDKVFIKEGHLRHHLTKCSGKKDKSRQCEKCGNKFASVQNLLRHVERVHLRLRRYLCTECPFAAKSPSVLRNHKFVHQGVHPFQCDKCSFTCVQAYQLVSHMRTHTGEKPYKCTQCKYAAAWNVQLKEHVKVHSMESAVICENCEIMFKNEKTKHIHMKKQKCAS